MPSLNKVQIIGRLGADPELRYTASGKAVANFSMATSEKWAKDGETNEKTEWHKIQVWGKLAEICGKYLTKGSMAYIEGRLQTRKYEDRDGVTRYITEINAHSMILLGGNSKDQEDGRDSSGTLPDDDDIPF